jgi:hypothetical protein
MATEGNFPKADGDILYETDVHYASGIVGVEAAENITAGNVVYIHLTDGKAYVSDTGTANDIRASGVALETKTTGQTLYVMTRGVYLTSSLTAKEDYYLGASGAVSTTRSGIRIGTALSTTELFVNIVQDDKDLVGAIKPYAKSFTGVPSNNLSAFWVECNGQVLSDAESPFNGQTIPNLNNSGGGAENRFLRGATTSGGTGGATSHTHTLTNSGGKDVDGWDGDPWYTNLTTSVSNVPPYYDVVLIMKIK